MEGRDRDRAKRSNTPPAEGERAAVVGLSGQYHLAAHIVLAKLATLEWVRVADPSAGIADDFQFRAGPTRYAIQVKWAQYPGSFKWGELANPSSTKPSLLSQMAEAWRRIRATWDGPLELHLRSNENPSTASPRDGTTLANCGASAPRHFAAFIARSFTPVRENLRSSGGGWADVESLEIVTDWQPAWDVFRTQSGLDDDTFAAFIRDFTLNFGPLVDDQLVRNDATEKSDIGHLAATLQALVADPARPRQLDRTELLDRLGWANRLRYRYPHAFPVPTIYAANEAARQDLQNQLRILAGGYVGLVGPAGSGKSTLLASLSWPGRRLVRYYAFVPDAPDPLSGRGEADSFLHDITLALEQAGLPRSGHGNDLRSQRTVLAEQLDQAGRRWSANGEETVVIVDGLDHIPREQHPTRSLLEELPAPAALPDGVFVVLGTQTTAILPASVREALKRENRTVGLPPLSATEVLELADASGPGGWLLPGQRDRLVVASEGHPLALTYLLEELVALEKTEPGVDARVTSANQVLDGASAYGGEVLARYSGYLRATDGDPDLLDLLAAVARLRAPVDIDWLRTWVEPRIMDTFVLRTSMFFRRDGSVWRFIHNSFRRFLAEETAQVADAFDADRDRAFHVKLADICANSSPQWAIYRDEELAHRFLAGQFDQVISSGTPPLLRAKLFDLRPLSAVRDHALLGLRAAAVTDDHATYVRMLLFLNELWQREYVIEPAKLANAMVKLGPPERALEHLVAGGSLRVPAAPALSAAARLAREGHSEAAAEILGAVGSLTELIQDRWRAGDRELVDAVADWAEAKFHISGVDAVLAQLDDQLPLPTGLMSSEERTPAHLPEEGEVKWEAERQQRESVERDDTVIASRNQAMARCFDLLSEIRDEVQLTAMIDRVDNEASSGWRARARVVRAVDAYRDGDRDAVLRWVREVVQIDSTRSGPVEDHDDEEDSRLGGAGRVPLSLRLESAEVLIRAGLLSAPEIDQLVPPDTAAAWPSAPSGQDGLKPFLTVINLCRLRGVRPSEQPGAVPADPHEAGPRQAGERRFRGALRQLADLEARQLAASIGHGTSPYIVGEADPIIRLLEVPVSQTRDWTGWYYVRDAARGLFRRLIRLAAADGADRVLQLLDRFADAWMNPDRARYWTPELQQSVLGAIIETDDGDVAQRVQEHLDRLEKDIPARAGGPHDQTETWLAQADLWLRAGNRSKAEASVRSGIGASLGPGIHDDDRQLSAWLDWLDAAANHATVSREELISTARIYAARLASVDDADGDTEEAAARLISLIGAVDPGVSTDIAGMLCEEGVLDEVDAIEAVLVGAAREPNIPISLVAVASVELLIPLLKEPSRAVAGEIGLRRGPGTPEALATIARAERTWSAQDPGHDEPPSTPVPDLAEQLTQAPSTAQALLAAMRATTNIDDPHQWTSAMETIAEEKLAPPVARALLSEVSRLRLVGETLGGIVAMAARAGQANKAAEVLAEALARTPAYGWIRHYDGGSRLNTFRAAVRYRDPTLVRLAATDLAGALASGAITSQILPDDLRRIAEVIGGPDVVAGAWNDIAEYLNIYAPIVIDGPSEVDISPIIGGSAVGSIMKWVSSFFGHPVRLLDFGARRVFHAELARENGDAQLVLANSIRKGGWLAEASLHTLVTSPHPIYQLAIELAEAIDAALISDDGISRDLARRFASVYALPIAQPPQRSLPDTYRLELPRLPKRAAPELDPEGVPYLDLHDPQQVVAPFDALLRMLASHAGLEEEAVLYRAASIARALNMPWIRGGHREQARRLKARGQRHTYRPWAYMAGRRALGIVLAELLDAKVLGTPPPLPSYYLGLVDEALLHVEPAPLDESNPQPWRQPDTSSYDVRGWCHETSDAVNAYSVAISAAPTYVLAEASEWCTLEWGKPVEARKVRTEHGEGSPNGLIVASRKRWEQTYKPAGFYPDLDDVDWVNQPLVVEGWEPHTDPRYLNWLALHPAVADQLDWIPDGELFGWCGADGFWRARTILRVRGQLSHAPPAPTYCAEVWQVILSDRGLAEVSREFGPLRRELELERQLPPRPREDRPDGEQSSASAIVAEPTFGDDVAEETGPQ